MFNVYYDKSLKQYQVLDENWNLINRSMKREELLYDVLHKIVNDDLIDQSLANEHVSEIYLFLVEKIHLADNKDNHKMQLFEGTLNSKAKRNLLIAFNKYMINYLSAELQSEITLEYE